ncbi:MAG: hypothetical protein ACYCTF_09265, partial [Acidiferrobacter sp.]
PPPIPWPYPHKGRDLAAHWAGHARRLGLAARPGLRMGPFWWARRPISATFRSWGSSLYATASRLTNSRSIR